MSCSYRGLLLKLRRCVGQLSLPLPHDCTNKNREGTYKGARLSARVTGKKGDVVIACLSCRVALVPLKFAG